MVSNLHVFASAARFFTCFIYSCVWLHVINPLPLLFKSLLPGQEDCVFLSRHLNLHTKPEKGIPYREKIITIKLKKTE
jgi:hypothetical protein